MYEIIHNWRDAGGGWFAAAIWYVMYLMASHSESQWRKRAVLGLETALGGLVIVKDLLRELDTKEKIIQKYGRYQEAEKERVG